jgi:hypothetical protein
MAGGCSTLIAAANGNDATDKNARISVPPGEARTLRACDGISGALCCWPQPEGARRLASARPALAPKCELISARALSPIPLLSFFIALYDGIEKLGLLRE